MGLNLSHIRDYIVNPVLMHLGPEIPFSLAAVQIGMATGQQESAYIALHQYGVGPALGLWQMEPRTAKDHFDWLKTNHALNDKVRFFSRQSVLDDPTEMIGNLYLACAMMRVHYWRVPNPLPQLDDITGQWNYYKQFYNTPAGAATWAQFHTAWITANAAGP